ncbi:MAG: UDP-3-O-(3-hydroxymyristoyl)glucosamine N-acyltransferase [Candidatus Aminicenantes bacterium]|nr:UDP-3-O-(3-hydroxymyristoyl)glucosamine N-acyltransferase [Candidatus Aminicenantes bacterium]
MKKKPYNVSFSLSVEELAKRLKYPYEGDGNTLITGVGSLDKAQKGHLTFLNQKKFRTLLETTRASAVILTPEETFDRLPVIRAKNPQLAFIQAVELFLSSRQPSPGIHPSAFVDSSAKLGRNVLIGALACIGEEVEIGDNTIVHPLACIYPSVKIGRDCTIHSHVTLREQTEIGNRVIIHCGVVVGADGFGYLQDEYGSSFKIPQIGKVRIEDNVEIGANSTIDRAALDETVIGAGTKIDNLVHIGHNVEIGRDSIIVAQVGISGSTKIGKNVIIAGQAGLVDNIRIGDRVVIGPQTGVQKSIPAGAQIMGSPSMDFKKYSRMTVSLKGLDELKKTVRMLKKKISDLEKRLKS